VPVLESVEWHQNQQNLGVWKNWRAALSRLVASSAPLLAITQDDIQVCGNLQAYVTRAVTSITGKHLLSPYTSTPDAIRSGYSSGWRDIYPGWNYIGACFWCFDREMGVWLDEHLPQEVEHNRCVDAQVGKALLTQQIPIFIHLPSLVEHLGDECSTAGHAPNPKTRRGYDYIQSALPP